MSKKTNQINFADVESFFSDAGGDEGVVAALAEPSHDLDLLFLRQTLLALKKNEAIPLKRGHFVGRELCLPMSQTGFPDS